jgi:hypothetical protein
LQQGREGEQLAGGGPVNDAYVEGQQHGGTLKKTALNGFLASGYPGDQQNLVDVAQFG